LRTIKAFTLEGGMERRVDAQTRESQKAADKLAGLSNRATPLMETLGGVAVGLLALYVGYRIIYGGRWPANSFPALPLSCWPTSRSSV
jgi:ATP-binding cassette subfamily B protein